MDIIEAIKTRRTTRQFNDEKLSPEVITSIEKAILHSPSGGNSQEYHIVIVQDPKQLQTIRRFSPGLSGEPPALLVLCSNKLLAFKRGGTDTVEHLRFVNLGIVASYIMFTAHSLGVGNGPIRGFNEYAVSKILNLPEDVSPELLIALGYSDQPPRPKKLQSNREVISHDEFGQY